jgi:hypothetical protein
VTHGGGGGERGRRDRSLEDEEEVRGGSEGVGDRWRVLGSRRRTTARRSCIPSIVRPVAR